MLNSSELFSYTTLCSSFKWIEPLFLELSCTQTDTHQDTKSDRQTHTDGHQYSIGRDTLGTYPRTWYIGYLPQDVVHWVPNPGRGTLGT